ncbi:coiled-coil domain-containing protein 92 [Engraulis encrasicolus]|uniref:coiled-coil domain-containing protein 92 n=1 Tax=Engraulis encrasicolus TaxID=184585 RepID=UPI002FD4E949
MASVSVTLENQLHSAQKNLLFLQQDHANTLKGLHAEIRRLQQHCTDLTYELTVKSSDPTDSSEERCRALQRRCEELEAQLREKEEENAELLRELEQKAAMMGVLEETLRERERSYMEQLKHKSQRLAVLSGELEQRASTIAYLTAQLHATKRRLLAGGGAGGSAEVPGGGAGGVEGGVTPTAAAAGGSSAASAAAAGSQSGSSSSASPAYRPAPPTQPQPPDTPTRRRMRKSLSQPLHAEWAELYRQGAGPDSRRLILREAALDAMPDPTPFLQPREPRDLLHGSAPLHATSPQPLHKSRPAVIPPINASSASSSSGSERTTNDAPRSGSATPTGSPGHTPTPTRLPAVPLGPSQAFSPKGSPGRHAQSRQQRAHVGVAHRIPHSPTTTTSSSTTSSQPTAAAAAAAATVSPSAPHPHPPSRPLHAELHSLAVDQVNGGGAKVVRKRSGTDRTV